MKSDETELSSSNTSQEQEVETQEVETQEVETQEVETQEVETQEVETQEAAESSDDEIANEATDGDWKPDPETRQSGAKRGKFGGKNLCKVCGISYVLLGSLVKHAWSHVDEEEAPCVCGVCGDLFETSEELKSHLKNKYKKTHECSFCRKSFLTVTGLKRHVTLHTGDRPFKCDVCGKAFAHASNLSIHRWVHREEKPYKCDVCPKAFGLKGSLQAHRRLHGKRERFICNVCGKSLLDMRSGHLGIKLFVCSICGKACSRQEHLTVHMRTHNGERPYQCTVCAKAFTQSHCLKTHMKSHRQGDEGFLNATCP
ncbi:hypothetical protein F7725_005037 [Dissostichus mawsoni]|uniref:C2H2-type domain-containing protein n=1 Tax=Dissostichus mawsoni TaxID=36200 RepID=A0A7J5XL64_DISMA|nr:hypothetical protein F7725_005037 [Dissostichus mawsoni]